MHVLDADKILPVSDASFSSNKLTSVSALIALKQKKNKELFENAPPYMIIGPLLKGGLYMSAVQTSKLIFKLTCIHVI